MEGRRAASHILPLLRPGRPLGREAERALRTVPWDQPGCCWMRRAGPVARWNPLAAKSQTGQSPHGPNTESHLRTPPNLPTCSSRARPPGREAAAPCAIKLRQPSSPPGNVSRLNVHGGGGSWIHEPFPAIRTSTLSAVK
ncbi:predicted protein [Coccidioides posadasii str. Silveira]|uniref:Predicted protein n=1 Tax=Coccidioides posadasii (strain RMSCC 757 / Silveira) TaxID=443226 RepID=E9DAW8_COCPS|nr:predicted protein [Coccidioides posadasii str. Silveira]